MSYPHGKAKVNASNPRAFGICDRCGFLFNHSDLRWQFDYRGRNLANLRILVCDTCMDLPQPQLKPRILPPDPMPILNARPERYKEYETDERYTVEPQPEKSPTINAAWFWTGLPVPTGEVRVTQNNQVRVTQQTGFANGSLNHQPGKCFQVPGDDDIGLPYNNIDTPRTGAIYPYILQADWTNSDDNSVNWNNNLSQNVFMSLNNNLNINFSNLNKINLEDSLFYLILEDATGALVQEINDY